MATAVAACVPGAGTSSPSPQSDFIYRRPTLSDDRFKFYLSKFKEQYGKNAVLSSVSTDYHTVTLTELLGGARFDVIEADGGNLGGWYTAKVVQGIDGLPGLDKIKADLLPGAITDLTAPDGQLAGLPYYSTYFTFYYNAELFDKANLKPPQTWAEVLDAARTLKSRGIASVPLAPVWRRDFGGGSYSLVSMAFAEGMEQLFDDKLNPVYESHPAMLQSLNTMKTLFAEGLVPADVLTYGSADAVNTFNSQKAAMFHYQSYFGKRLNFAPSPIAGKVKMILAPGKTHQTWAQTAGHFLGAKASRTDAWDLLKFISATDKTGAYLVPKGLYAIELGLPVPFKSLNTDPDVQKSLAEWVDVPTHIEQLNRTKSIGPALNAPWFAEWTDTFITQMQKFIGGGTDAQAALKVSADLVRSRLK